MHWPGSRYRFEAIVPRSVNCDVAGVCYPVKAGGATVGSAGSDGSGISSSGGATMIVVVVVGATVVDGGAMTIVVVVGATVVVVVVVVGSAARSPLSVVPKTDMRMF